MNIEELQVRALEYWNVALGYMSQPALLFQISIIAVLFVPAWFLSNRVEPLLEKQARKIKGMPGTLRLIVAFLRRMEWLFFVLFLGIAYVLTSALQWPESNHLIYSAMLLAGAWLSISVVSHVIRKRTIGRLFGLIVWLYVAASILGITDDIAATLNGISLGFKMGDEPFTVLRLLRAVLFIGVVLWLALAAGNFFDKRIQQVDELTPSLRVLLGKILRITLVVFAVMIAMQSLSIDLTALTVLSGAVGVGIGFGLQKVVSNFISGMIILLDQSIKPGDTITVGETFGWIRELRARFVSVVTRDGREYLIPNEDFITTQVINWSFSDRYVRLDVPFGVAYDSDPHEVVDIAIAAAASVDRVVATYRPPVCWMTEFGDSSINFLLRFWIEDPQQGLTNIRGKVMMALWDAFKENGISIPFPHREVIMKTPVTVQSTEPQS